TQTVSSTREMKSQKEMFISAVKEYERNCKHKTGVDLRRAHNWSEVLGKINDAREKYEGINQNGFCKTLRHGFRSFASAQPIVTSWLRLLQGPSMDASFLCGGIKIVFDVRNFFY